MLRFFFSFFYVGVLAFGAAACTSTTNSTPGSSGDPSTTPGTTPTLSAAECSRRCTAKLATCSAPADQAKAGCDRECASGLTESQVSCIETKDCDALARVDSLEALCAPPPTSTSTATTPVTPPPPLPTTLTITGSMKSGTKATHSKVDQDIASLIVLNEAPSFSPSKPSPLPNLADKGVTVAITSPPRGSCTPSINFTLNSSAIGVVVTGADRLPSADCAIFTDAIASDGFKATLSNVPYPNSTTKATVTIDIH